MKPRAIFFLLQTWTYSIRPLQKHAGENSHLALLWKHPFYFSIHKMSFCSGTYCTVSFEKQCCNNNLFYSTGIMGTHRNYFPENRYFFFTISSTGRFNRKCASAINLHRTNFSVLMKESHEFVNKVAASFSSSPE